MEQQLKVYDFLNGSGAYWSNHEFKLVNKLADADILCLNGGADIGTEIYGETPVASWEAMSGGYKKSRRDELEIEQYNLAKSAGKFIFGICRGAQLVTCLEGGSLWQHVDKHYGTHPMTDVFTNKTYRTTSVHHQMMRPNKALNHQIIAVASESNYKVSERDEWRYKNGGEDSKDPEIIWYPTVRALCVQGHPEYSVNSEFASYCTQLIRHLWSDPVWPPQAVASEVAV